MQDADYASMTLEEFVRLPNVVDFNTNYDAEFREFISDKPYIKVGTILTGGIVIAYAPEERIQGILRGLRRFYTNKYPFILGLMDRLSLSDAGIINIQNTPNLDLKGRGVLIGFVDTGIDYTNNAFRYEDGSSKIAYIWDQTAIGKPPQESYFGHEYSNEELNEALKTQNPHEHVPHVDTVGHGTFLASVAAGREIGEYVGAAPDSEIIMVKLRRAHPFYIDLLAINPNAQDAYESTDVMLGVRYILQKAQKLQRPVVICLGLGTNAGSHDGSSLFEKYFYSIVEETGVVLNFAVGNEANSKHHTNGSIAKEGDTQDVQFRCDNNVTSLSITIVTSPHDRMPVSIISPTGDTIAKVPITSNTFQKKLALENTTVRVQYFLGETNLVFIAVLQPTNGIWTIRLHGEVILDGEFNAWIALPQFVGGTVEALRPNPNITAICPATSNGPITSGSYNPRDGSLSISSSWGPTRTGAQCPDLVAPGVNIGGVVPGGYGTMSGTSVAAAITAGASALVLQWAIVYGNDPQINTLRMRTLLIRGCDRNQDLVYPNHQWGYGKLNLLNSFNVIRRL